MSSGAAQRDRTGHASVRLSNPCPLGELQLFQIRKAEIVHQSALNGSNRSVHGVRSEGQTDDNAIWPGARRRRHEFVDGGRHILRIRPILSLEESAERLKNLPGISATSPYAVAVAPSAGCCAAAYMFVG